MIRKTALYQVQREASAAVEAAVREFLAHVARAEPHTEYVALRLDDGSFLHLMGFESAEAEQKHESAEYTRRFVDKLHSSGVAAPTCSHFEQITP
jgi:quinol monooxygenase YgiN